jgi:phage terminase large subunit
MRVDFPKKLRGLLDPHDYKVIFGGRDGIKSWSVAQALLALGAQNKVRFLCARETQKSIAESVHHLLSEQILRLNLGGYYRVEKARIIGTVQHQLGMYGQSIDRPGISEFVFAGLRHNVAEIKSYEGLNGVWVEEAGNVSKNSWEVVIPTIRTEGSEIWITFNPQLPSDDTYTRWVLNPPPGTLLVRTSYEDNLWLSETSRRKIELLKVTDRETFDHIYGGSCQSALKGAVYGKEIAAAEKEGRLTGRVPYDPSRPVETFWDLGWGDYTAIWFVQRFPFEYRFIDFVDGSHEPLTHYLKLLQDRPYLYGTDWLPHDARAKSLGTGKSIEDLMRAAGRKVQIVPMLSVADGINAGRTIFPQSWFDAGKCDQGIQYLRRYRYGEIETLGTATREPLHDDASHAADAFRYAGVALKPPQKPKEAQRAQRPQSSGAYAWMG